MGLCYHKMGDDGKALAEWAECCKTSPGREGQMGPEGQAAALAMAEIYLSANDPRLEYANEALSQAMNGVTPPMEWKNNLVDLARVRAIFELACRKDREAGKFELARDAVTLYEKIAEPARPPLVKAEILADWGRARRVQAQLRKDPEDQQKEEEEARELFRRAGAAYESAATKAAAPDAQADLLWQAALCSRDALDNAQVIVLLNRFLKVNTRGERRGEGWWLLGEAHRQEKQLNDAKGAYEQCLLALPSRFAYRAQYQLALFAREQGQVDQAAEILRENLKRLRQDPNADADAREKTQFTLGQIYFQQKKYEDVIRQLEEALGLFPNSPETTLSHFQLAQAYRQRAIQMNQDYLNSKSKDPQSREHFWKEYRNYLQKAAHEFYDLALLLDDKRETRNALTAEGCIDVPFQAAECHFYLGKYEEALGWYASLAKRHEHHPEGLKALAGTVRCLAALKRQEEVTAQLAKIRDALGEIEEPQRKAWEEWIHNADPRKLPVAPPSNQGQR